MLKWIQLLIITVVLCFLTQNSPNAQELGAIVVLAYGADLIISEVKKPISH